jgi:hypothetical protein
MLRCDAAPRSLPEPSQAGTRQVLGDLTRSGYFHRIRMDIPDFLSHLKVFARYPMYE